MKSAIMVRVLRSIDSKPSPEKLQQYITGVFTAARFHNVINWTKGRPCLAINSTRICNNIQLARCLAFTKNPIVKWNNGLFCSQQ